MRLRSIFACILAQPRSWLCAVVRRNHLEAEMDAELAFHVEHLTADLIRAGQAPKEAARQARIALGTVTVHKEGMRASLGLRWWDQFWADLRYGMRYLRKNPGFTTIAATSLALAVGANTTIFSLAKQVLYDRLKVPHSEQLRLLRWDGDDKVAVHEMWGDFDTTPSGGMTASVFSYPAYQELRARNRVLEDLFAYKEDGMNATIQGNAQRVVVEMVSGNTYGALGVKPQLGRLIQPSDDTVSGSGAVAVISDSLWEREYGRAKSIVGQTIKLNQTMITIVGVNPREFTGIKNVQESPDIFVPISLQPLIDPKPGKVPVLADPNMWWVNIMARAKPGVHDSEAQAALNVQLTAVTRNTMPLDSGDTMPHLVLADGSRGLHFTDRMFKKPLYVLLGFTGLVLLLACANIANLLLARGTQRRREMSVRLALGAGRARILRQLLTESLLLAGLGGLGGLLLSFAGRNAIPKLLVNPWERIGFNISFDWGVYLFAAGVTVLTGVLFGLAPAWIAARTEVSSSLKATAQTTTRRRKGLGGKAVVVFQIALSTMLVVGAGLFLRTTMALNSVDVGFKADHLLLFEINPPAKFYPAGKDVLLHAQLEQGFASVPGVDRVAAGSLAYIAENMSSSDFLPEGESFDASKRQTEDFNDVGASFFQTMGIPMIAGRSFGPQDTATSPKVGIINQSLARKRFPNENPIGRRFKADRDAGSVWIHVVGICGDTHYAGLRDDPPAQFFLPYIQQPEVGGMTYQIRTHLDAASLVPVLRRVVQSVDRDLPMVDVRTQREQIDATMKMERAFSALTASFGLLALALACVGIYGIMACSVANRRNEIGIRLALGAQPGQVRGMILRESIWLATAGIGAGVVSALLLMRLIKSMLYGVQAYDPISVSAGVLLLLAVALGASWIPARSAAILQPIEALRHE
jgi:predicted permease